MTVHKDKNLQNLPFWIYHSQEKPYKSSVTFQKKGLSHCSAITFFRRVIFKKTSCFLKNTNKKHPLKWLLPLCNIFLDNIFELNLIKKVLWCKRNVLLLDRLSELFFRMLASFFGDQM